VKTGKVFAADLRKRKIHSTVKKLTAWHKLNRLSQRKAVAVLAKYYFHTTFASPEAGKKVADRQIHIQPPFWKNSYSTIRPYAWHPNRHLGRDQIMQIILDIDDITAPLLATLLNPSDWTAPNWHK
jgi:hypothetical protein